MEYPDTAPRRAAEMKNAIFWRWAALLGSGLCVLLLDQVAKMLVLRNLAPGESIVPIPALGDYFSITLSHNTGAAFSILPQAGDLFLIVAIAMGLGIIFFYRRIPPGRWVERTALGVLLGGTLGNALDRIQHGHVIDWVHLKIPGLISNVSNLADHAIVIGILVLFLSQWRRDGRAADRRARSQDADQR